MSLCSNRQLLSLIKNEDNEEAKSIIKKENLYNVADPSNNTLLHYAVKYKNSEIVQFLIESGCAIDAQNNIGQTPLMRCLKSALPCQRIVELLLRAGADVHTEDDEGMSVVDKVDNIEWLTEEITRFEILKMLLQYGSVLYLDCLVLVSGNEGVVKSLLDTNIDLSMADVEGKTLVHALAANGIPGVIEQLRGRNYNVNVRDGEGWTPLMYATKNHIVNSVEFLLNEGADIEATNINKETPLCLAFYYHSVDEEAKATVQILLENEANVQVETDNDDLKTIFDMIGDNCELAKLPLAHLALKKALGTTITDIIREKFNSNLQFKAYFKDCQEELSIEIYPSVTLFDILTASERKLERCFHNEELAPKLADFQTSIDYFDTILRKRVAKARKMIELRKVAAKIICKLIELDYDSYPFVVDEIASYLEEQDIECLKLIENELC